MIQSWILLGLAAAAGIEDFRRGLIPNWLIASGLAVAVAVALAEGGFPGLVSPLIGCLVGGGLLLIPYLLGGMGAGDVKLLAMFGALVGWPKVLDVATYGILMGGLMAVCVLLAEGKLLTVVAEGIRWKTRPHDEERAPLPTIPFGVALAAGAIFSVVDDYLKVGLL